MAGTAFTAARCLLRYPRSMTEGFTVGFEGGGDGPRPAGGRSPGPPGRGFDRRRRNRHGRGLRGDVLPAGLPGSRTRADRFEDLVAESAERLEVLWGQQIAAMDFSVELLPRAASLDFAEAAGGPVPLGRALGATPRQPARVVIYRRPVEQLAGPDLLLPEVIHLAVVEQVAELLMRSPEEIDPDYRPWDGDR